MTITPPHDLPMDGRADLARYPLTPTHVATVLGVKRQLIPYWATEGRLAATGRVWLGGILQGRHRWFSTKNVTEFAEACEFALDWTRLPLELQRTLAVGWFHLGAQAAEVAMLDERLSEAEAARQLGLSTAALRKRRERGSLDQVLAASLRPSESGHGGATYSQLAVWRVAGVV